MTSVWEKQRRQQEEPGVATPVAVQCSSTEGTFPATVCGLISSSAELGTRRNRVGPGRHQGSKGKFQTLQTGSWVHKQVVELSSWHHLTETVTRRGVSKPGAQRGPAEDKEDERRGGGVQHSFDAGTDAGPGVLPPYGSFPVAGCDVVTCRRNCPCS